jgi:hypothetical protein
MNCSYRILLDWVEMSNQQARNQKLIQLHRDGGMGARWQIYFIIVRGDAMAAAGDLDGDYLLLGAEDGASTGSSEPVFLPAQDSYVAADAPAP